MAYQPKSYRKFIAGAAVAAVVAPSFAGVAGAAANFTDVNDNYKVAVDYLVSKGISGISETEFGTYQNIKRVDAAVFVVKALGLDVNAAPASGFTDVPARAVKEVNALKEAGITAGKSTTEFGAQDLITRGELAVWLDKAFDLKGEGDISAFTDATGIYTNAIKALVANNITKGTSDTTFGTKDPAKRGDFAIFVKKSADTVVDVAPAVESVSAINATQVEVKFNKVVDKASLFTDGKSGAFKATVTLTTLDSVASGSLTGTLSEDGKTLTVTAANPLSKRYDVVVDGVKTTDSKDVTKYEKMVTIAADKTAPAILGTEKVSSSQVKVKFSEPMKAFTSVSFKYADGTAVTGVTGGISAGATEAVFSMDSNVTVNKEIVATFIGAQDQAGNLLTPNPATVSFTKGAKDGVAPAVSSITQTEATKFAVKFSEELLSVPTVSITGANVTKVEKDTTDPTKYIVSTDAVLDGAKTVVVSSFTDLSGEVGTITSKVVTFVKEAAAPKVVSNNVVVDSTNNKQYLEVTFDKDVVLSSAKVAATGSYVKDYVTTPVTLTATNVSYKDTTATNKKVVRVELDTFLGATDAKDAVYTLDLSFTGVSSAAAVAAETAKTTFTRGEDGVASNTDLVAVSSVAQSTTDNNKVLVTFNKAVDGASATNVANYSVDGAVIESVTLNAASGGTQVAVLNLKAGSNTFTGTRNINLSGVKALGSSKVMTPFFTNTVSIKENVAPTVTKAVLTDVNAVTLTFSEAVTNAAVSGADFELYIGGVKVATNDTITTATQTTAATTLELTLEANVTADNLAKGLSIKAVDTIDVQDAATNKVKAPVTITVQQ